jgi:superfamily I DNA/RNA helicase
VLCYNKTLAARLEQLMASRGLDAKVQVYNFHRWCRHMLVSYHVELPPEGSEDFFGQMVERVMAGVERGQIPRFQYGAILVDEGHDFEPDWYKLIVQMVDPATNALLVLYDDAQNIYGRTDRRKTTWKSLGVQAHGHTTILRINYRNTVEVLALAKSFTHELLAERTDDDEGIPLIAPESAGRHGPVPELARAADARDEARLLVAALTDEHDRGRAWQDMAVIHRHQWQGDGLSRVLADAGIPCSLAKGNGKHALFAGGDTVKLVTMHSSKGLEFPRVIIPDLGAMPRAGEDENEEARLLYVAMTRATEQLLLLHHTESAFTRRIRASINDIQRQLAGEPDVRVSVL